MGACTKQLKHSEFTRYVTNVDNGLVVTQEVNNVKADLQYWPQQLLAYQEVKGQDSIDIKEYTSALENYEQYHYLKLKLSTNGQGILHAHVRDRNKYSQLVNRLSFAMGQYAYLIQQPTDTLEFIDCHIPRYYGHSNSTDLMLIYKRDRSLTGDLRFQLKDLDLGTGELSFVIEQKAIKSIPKLLVE